MKISDSAFIETYQRASSAKDCGRTLGISGASVENRANRLRLLGVPMKRFASNCGPSRDPADIQGLRDLAASLGGEKGLNGLATRMTDE